MIIGHNPGSTINANWRFWDCGVTWAHLQPQPNNWVWHILDQYVNNAKGPTMLVLGHPPAWAALGGSNSKQAPWLPAGTNLPPATIELWENYCKTVMTRYRGRIKYYQIWNEPADPMFYSGSLRRLAKITKVAQDIAAKVDPKARIVSAPLQPRPASGWPSKAEALMDAYAKFDFPFNILSAHIYPETGLGIGRWKEMTTNVKKMARDYKIDRKQLFITETNYNVPSGPEIPLERGQKMVKDTLSIAENLGVDGLWWYAAPGMFGLQPNSLV